MANGFVPLMRFLHRIAGGPPGGGPTDAELLERFVRQQDEAAFTVLFQRHGRMVWNVCCRILHDPHLAEDAFQAAFLVLVRKAGSIAQGDRLANWLYGVAVRVAKKAKVQAIQRQAQQREMPDMPSEPLAAAPGWQPLSDILDDEVRQLPARYRAPLVLCYLEGMSQEEAAQKLGCAQGTLRVWLMRGREKLRQRLQRRGLAVPAAALAALLAENAASAAVPSGLADTTLALTHAVLTTGQLGWASASVAALTQGVLQDMMLIKVKIAAGLLAATMLLAGSGWAVQQALADKATEPVAQETEKPAAPAAKEADQGPRLSKLDLTPQNFASLYSVIHPDKEEWRHLRVNWFTDIVAARKKAAQEDKPIFIVRTGGAGYNDPLGTC